MEVQVGPPVITISFDDHVLVCSYDGQANPDDEHGFFVRDTRLVSGYSLWLGRAEPLLLDSSGVEPYSARFEYTNPELETAIGTAPARTLHLRLDRTVDNGVHEDYDLTNYGGRPVVVELSVRLESDFADLFDVKAARRIRRGSLQATWDAPTATQQTCYQNSGFRRGIAIRAARSGSPTEYANGAFSWRAELDPGASWHTCLLWTPELGEPAGPQPDNLNSPCHMLLGRDTVHSRAQRDWMAGTTQFQTSSPAITAVVQQAVRDLAGLRMHVHDAAAASWAPSRTQGGSGRPGQSGAAGKADVDAWVPAAGIPWFVTLFGRDSLVVSLQTLSLSPRFALGALRALGQLQADAYDDARDMQPGKIPHEIRHGELAALHLIPHTPYYGTHDATTLYVWTAAQAWWWHGDRAELDAVRPHVERALAWIDTDGDLDGDGLQEYRTRAKGAFYDSYYNQSWKDSRDGIVDADGHRPPQPIALCELQGYVIAAKRAWADVLDSAYREQTAARRLRAAADRLAGLLEERFWWPEEGTYYLGLDGAKQPLRTVASNPGHLLWCRAIDPERARRTASRLLSPDMWSGWGIRTLSARHPAFNPFSYQLGSVWPHDSMIFAAGLRNYGLDPEAHKVIKGVFDAAARFQSLRAPELFAGLDRDPGGFPAQYLGANVPQAWASGAMIHAMGILLGLAADATADQLTVDPCLPAWLHEVRARNVRAGGGRADVVVRRGLRDAKPEVSGSGSLRIRRPGSAPGSSPSA